LFFGERGIRTFETSTRFTLDVVSIPVLERVTHLPVIADLSHATGLSHRRSRRACGRRGRRGRHRHRNASRPARSAFRWRQAVTMTELDALMGPVRAARRRRRPLVLILYDGA
jgi:hypothetical protein